MVGAGDGEGDDGALDLAEVGERDPLQGRQPSAQAVRQFAQPRPDRLDAELVGLVGGDFQADDAGEIAFPVLEAARVGRAWCRRCRRSTWRRGCRGRSARCGPSSRAWRRGSRCRAARAGTCGRSSTGSRSRSCGHRREAVRPTGRHRAGRARRRRWRSCRPPRPAAPARPGWARARSRPAWCACRWPDRGRRDRSGRSCRRGPPRSPRPSSSPPAGRRCSSRNIR